MNRTRCIYSLGIWLCLAARAENMNVVFPGTSGVINVKSAPYNAAGDGVQDDTRALAAALTNANRTIYVPNGVYLVTNTLWFGGPSSGGAAGIWLQGQSQTGTIIKLKDSAAGFGSTNLPRSVIWTGGNDTPQRFGNSVRNLTIDTGTNNPGAVGLAYYANNAGTCRDVTIRGAGWIGLEMSHSRANGPCFVKNVTVDGAFVYGVRTGYALESITIEDLLISGSTGCGWLNENTQRVAGSQLHQAAGQTLSIRHLVTTNMAVPALWNPSGHVVILDSAFYGSGSAATQPAVFNGQKGTLLVRDITATGYACAVSNHTSAVPGLALVEWVSKPVVTQFPSTCVTLRLEVCETPDVPYDPPAAWANIKAFGATDWEAGEGTQFDNDAPAVQAAVDSGATTVFVPQGNYRILSPVLVRGNVRRITGVGAGSMIGGGNDSSGIPYTNIVWLVTTGTHDTVVIENMNCGSLQLCTGADNQSSRTLALRHLFLQPPRFTGPGDIFVEDVCARYWEFNGQRVWARQINPEGDETNRFGQQRMHLYQRGGSLWVLGLKTEDWPTILDTADDAGAEILGGMIYSLDDARAMPMIRASNAYFALFVCEYLGRWGQPYTNLVDETHGEMRRVLPRGAPAYPAAWSQHNDGTTDSSSGVVGSDMGLYVSKVIPEPLPLGMLITLLLLRR